MVVPPAKPEHDSHGPRILVLVVYFGRWPDYLPLFLEGCARNASIDFLFITDCDRTPIDALPNCRSLAMSLADVEALARERCGTQLHLEDPYKLCDLKPAYGDIFAEHVQGYDYWAWTDIDLVYGDLRAHLAELPAYDGFFFSRLWVSGVLGLLRTTPPMRTLYRQSSSWEEAFAAPGYVGFDECGRLWTEVAAAGDIDAVETSLDTFTHVVMRAARKTDARFHFDNLVHEDVPTSLRVDQEITDLEGRSFPLFHFVTAKSGWAFIYPGWSEVRRPYWVTRHGFFDREPSKGAALRQIASAQGMRHVARTLLRRSKTAAKRLVRGDVGFLWRDLVRRARGGPPPR